jgi:hypothetical protein
MIGVINFLDISNLAKRPYNPERREYIATKLSPLDCHLQGGRLIYSTKKG